MYQFTHQAIRLGLGYADRYNPAFKVSNTAIKVYQSSLWIAPDHLGGVLEVDVLHQHFFGATQEPSRSAQSVLCAQTINPLQSVLLDIVRHLVGPYCSGGIGAGRVGGGVELIKLDLEIEQ